MNFSISTSQTPHRVMLARHEKDSDELKTWLSDYYQDFTRDPSLPITPVYDRRELNSASAASSSVKCVDQIEAAFNIGMEKSRLCPFPLLINVEEKDQLREIANNVRSSNEYIHLTQGLKSDSSEQNYPRKEKDMAERLAKGLQVILAKINSDNTSHNFVNLKYKSIEFDDEPSVIPPSTNYEKKPDIVLVPKGIPESEMNLWKNVTTGIKLKVKSSDDLSTTVLHQISRFALAMVYCRPFSAVTYMMTITGNIARIYRYDARSFCLTEGALITDPEGFETFCKYIAFMAHPNREKECLRLENQFQVQCLDQSIKTYQSYDGDFKVLFNRLKLFGSRTVCFSGQALEISSTLPGEACEVSRINREEPIQTSSDKNLKEPLQIVIKLTWVAKKHEHNELDVLDHMHKNEEFSGSLSRFKVPRPLGTLFPIDQNFPKICDIPNLRKEIPLADGDLPLQFVSLVTECPVGTSLENCQILELVIVFKNLAQILLDAAKAGIQYRDLNLGNILQTGEGDSSDCLLIDFGNARIENKPRGEKQSGPIAELALDDHRSCTKAFSSIAYIIDLSFHRVKLFCVKRALIKEEKFALEREPGHYEEMLTELENQSPSEILHHFDDLQSAFFCFVCMLGIKGSPAKRKAFPTSLDKRDLINDVTRSIRWVEFEFSVQIVISSLAQKLAEIVHPTNRMQVLKQSINAKDITCLTKAEEEYFAQWINACNTAIDSLKVIHSQPQSDT